ncbi:MAG: hypothetical protein KF757_05160 [Phycisphaeraceae bacterium]|nr:hypothetical protein [Phycisphaeraceae bacterium]MCW5763843.1 hypothetical protein [Phycisphaeraceae bacterium]
MRGTFLLAACAGLASADLPVREVTIFKDGHAMVLRQGLMPVNAQGDVEIEELPRPILGTFWAYSATSGVKMSSVKVGKVDEINEIDPQNLHHLIRLAVGTDVTLVLHDGGIARGTLKRVSGAMAMLSGESAVAINLADVRRAEFHDESILNRKDEQTFTKDVMTIDLSWEGHAPANEAEVGLMYIERGLRWIPSYRVTLTSDDRAIIELSATLVNELMDLDNVKANLVIGVPSFMFEHTLDPMSLQEQVAQLGQYFDRASSMTGAALSNALMSQTARMSDSRGYRDNNSMGQQGSNVEVGSTDQAEDLYIFNVSNVTLKRGERLFVPLAVAEVPYESVYTLTLPIAPPSDMWQNFGTDQQREIARMLDRPTARHVLRLTNASEHPFTTAPALIIRDGQPLAQGMLRYTARTARVDLEVTSAVDIRVESSEREAQREHDGLRWNGNTYARVELTGSANLTNYKTKAVKIEVRKFVLGKATEANANGTIEGINFFTGMDWDQPSFAWWRWYGWPWWWSRLNSASRIDWTVELEPGESVNLECAWQYFWN